MENNEMTNKKIVIPITPNDKKEIREKVTDNEEMSTVKLGLIYLAVGLVIILVTFLSLNFQDTYPKGLHLLANFYLPWTPIFLTCGVVGAFILTAGTLLLIGREGLGFWIFKFLKKRRKKKISSK